MFIRAVRTSRYKSSIGSAHSGASQLALPAICAVAFGSSRVTGARDATKHIAFSCRLSYSFIGALTPFLYIYCGSPKAQTAPANE